MSVHIIQFVGVRSTEFTNANINDFLVVGLANALTSEKRKLPYRA